MNPTMRLRFISVPLLAVLATVASAGILSAEDYTGKFTLPFETKWGTATLPPGDYEFRLNIETSPYMIRVTGKDQTVNVFASGRSDSPRGGQSALLVVRRGRKAIVRTMHLADEGRVFTFGYPKGEPPLMAHEPQLIQRIAITAAAM